MSKAPDRVLFSFVLSAYISMTYYIWFKIPDGYWERLPYSARGWYDSKCLVDTYHRRFPDREYTLSPAGFTPDLGWVG